MLTYLLLQFSIMGKFTGKNYFVGKIIDNIEQTNDYYKKIYIFFNSGSLDYYFIGHLKV